MVAAISYPNPKGAHWPKGSDGPLCVPDLSAAEVWARQFSSLRTVPLGRGRERIAAVNPESRAVLIALAKAERPNTGTAVMRFGDLMAATGFSRRRLIWLIHLLSLAGACGHAEHVGGQGDGTVISVRLNRDRGL